MQEQKITMYLTFRFDNGSEEYKSFSGYVTNRAGRAYLKIVKAENPDKSYADFDQTVKAFLAACADKRQIINKISDCNGKFDIEVVTETSVNGFPAITVDNGLIDFINSLNGKFNVLDFDTYFI